jgi:hypothetical protein
MFYSTVPRTTLIRIAYIHQKKIHINLNQPRENSQEAMAFHSAECRHPECPGTSMLIQEWLQSGGKNFFPEKLKEFFFQ